MLTWRPLGLVSPRLLKGKKGGNPGAFGKLGTRDQRREMISLVPLSHLLLATQVALEVSLLRITINGNTGQVRVR